MRGPRMATVPIGRREPAGDAVCYDLHGASNRPSPRPQPPPRFGPLRAVGHDLPPSGLPRFALEVMSPGPFMLIDPPWCLMVRAYFRSEERRVGKECRSR